LGAITQQLADAEQDCAYVSDDSDWASDATKPFSKAPTRPDCARVSGRGRTGSVSST
jgi:hypothetical protein